MKLRKGDQVLIISGKDKGKKGKIEKVYPKQLKVLIPGVNIYKKHIKKSDQFPQGGKIEVPRPINISKVMLICPKCNKPTRVGFVIEKKKKFRFCKKCQSRIS